MLIEIHMIQNHSPANLNRDDLGTPKTCYFGGYLRSRISSQCLKRSIRKSEEFEQLLGGIRTRRLAEYIAKVAGGDETIQRRAEEIMKLIGFLPKKASKKDAEDDDDQQSESSKAAIYISDSIVTEMISLLKGMQKGKEEEAAKKFAELIATHTSIPDMALCGRMLEPDSSSKAIWKGVEDPAVEAALQASHAISTHEARPEVDYFTTAEDVPGSDAGAALIGEAMFGSACFYKYFSINWEQLLENLKKHKEHEKLAGHTVGAFLRGAAETTPSGKQNSFAAHNRPDGILVEFKNSPVSYANAFVKPVRAGERDLVGQSIAELAKYVKQNDEGYSKPTARLWFSPGGRYSLTDKEGKEDNPLNAALFKSCDELVKAVIKQLGLDWNDVQKVKL